MAAAAGRGSVELLGHYSELLTDERKETAAGFWQRANAYFASVGITVARVLTDNGSCYRSKLFAEAVGEDIKHKRTRPYRPQTNGKVERFNRTMLEEWAYAKPYLSESERTACFTAWSTPTFTTAATQHSAASHQQTSCPTCVDRTASGPQRGTIT